MTCQIGLYQETSLTMCRVNINDYFLEAIIEVAGYFNNMLYLFFTEFNTIKMQFVFTEINTTRNAIWFH